MKNVNCYKCNKKGNMAKTCPSNETDGRVSRVITTDSVPDSDEDPVVLCVNLSRC